MSLNLQSLPESESSQGEVLVPRTDAGVAAEHVELVLGRFGSLRRLSHGSSDMVAAGSDGQFQQHFVAEFNDLRHALVACHALQQNTIWVAS